MTSTYRIGTCNQYPVLGTNFLVSALQNNWRRTKGVVLEMESCSDPLMQESNSKSFSMLRVLHLVVVDEKIGTNYVWPMTNSGISASEARFQPFELRSAMLHATCAGVLNRNCILSYTTCTGDIEKCILYNKQASELSRLQALVLLELLSWESRGDAIRDRILPDGILYRRHFHCISSSLGP